MIAQFSAFFLSVMMMLMSIMMTATQSDAFLMRNNNFSTRQYSCYSKSTALANGFKQLPGESDIDFIERITTNSKALLEESSAVKPDENNEEHDSEQKQPKGKYVPIEEWDAERKAKGELSWEERVMFEGQQHGNQVRQNDILLRNLHSF